MLQIVYHASKAGACTHQRLTKKRIRYNPMTLPDSFFILGIKNNLLPNLILLFYSDYLAASSAAGASVAGASAAGASV